MSTPNSMIYLTDQKAKAEQVAYLAGWRDATQAIRMAITPEQRQAVLASMSKDHIMAVLLTTDRQIQAQRQVDSNILLENASWNKSEARAFIFNRARIDDCGRETDDLGNPIETLWFRQLPDTVSRPHQHYQFLHKTTGSIISREAYFDLPPRLQAEYEAEHYLTADLSGHSIVITSNDTARVSALIRQDILIGDSGYNLRYLIAMADGGLLESYRSVINAAFMELEPEHTDVNPLLLAHATQGSIQTCGHLLIAMIESVLYFPKSTTFLQSLTVQNLNIWHNIIKTCETGDDDTLASFISDEDFITYRNINQQPLNPSANQELDHDLLVKVHKEYFKQVLVPKFCTKLLNLMDINITQRLYHQLKPDTIREAITFARHFINYVPKEQRDIFRNTTNTIARIFNVDPDNT